MSEYLLRDGSRVSDRRLDRLQSFDERSRKFGIAGALRHRRARERVDARGWSVDVFLDQGREGACVGFGFSHELGARPVAVKGLSDAFAHSFYKDAQRIDEWEGEDYEGTSVLAGAKIAKQRGYCDEYRWCFSIDEIIAALAHEGPVVVGTNWLAGMESPDESGLLNVSGEVRGGHCYLLRGYNLNGVRGGGPAEPMFRIRNSWGLDWGYNGDAWIKVADYERALLPGGEACVLMGRRKVPQTHHDPPIAPGGDGRAGPPRPDSVAPPQKVEDVVADAEDRAGERQIVRI